MSGSFTELLFEGDTLKTSFNKTELMNAKSSISKAISSINAMVSIDQDRDDSKLTSRFISEISYAALELNDLRNCLDRGEEMPYKLRVPDDVAVFIRGVVS